MKAQRLTVFILPVLASFFSNSLSKEVVQHIPNINIESGKEVDKLMLFLKPVKFNQVLALVRKFIKNSEQGGWEIPLTDELAVAFEDQGKTVWYHRIWALDGSRCWTKWLPRANSSQLESFDLTIDEPDGAAHVYLIRKVYVLT